MLLGLFIRRLVGTVVDVFLYELFDCFLDVLCPFDYNSHNLSWFDYHIRRFNLFCSILWSVDLDFWPNHRRESSILIFFFVFDKIVELILEQHKLLIGLVYQLIDELFNTCLVEFFLRVLKYQLFHYICWVVNGCIELWDHIRYLTIEQGFLLLRVFQFEKFNGLFGLRVELF